MPPASAARSICSRSSSKHGLVRDVGGLQVPVHNAGCVGRGQCASDLDGAVEAFPHPQPFARDHLLQVAALDQFHSDEIDALCRVDVVNGDDVGVIERRGGLGLLHEAPLTLRIGDPLRRQDLDRHKAAQVRVAGFVDHTHPAFPELGEYLIVGDGSAGHPPALPSGMLIAYTRTVNTAAPACPRIRPALPGLCTGAGRASSRCRAGPEAAGGCRSRAAGPCA